MPVVGVQGAKGGVGASLISTNLGCALARHQAAVLIDLHGGSGGDDLLLNLNPQHSWDELLPVSGELRPEHLRKAACVHASGLHLLASSRGVYDKPVWPGLPNLIANLSASYQWIVLDLPSFEYVNSELDALQLDFHLIITTPDPIALRAVKRWAEFGGLGQQLGVGLIINQYSNRHPARALDLAQSVGLPLMASLPVDLRSVGFQVNFGRACTQDSHSSFGTATARLTVQLLKKTKRHLASMDVKSL